MIRRFLGMGWLMALRLLGVVLQLSIQLMVGRLAGPAGVGLLQLFTTWSCVLGEGLACGRPAHSMKTLAVAQQQYSAAQVRAYLSMHLRATARLWLLMLLFGTGIVVLMPQSSPVLWIILAAVPCFALQRLFAESLKAIDGPALPVGLENLVPPLVVVTAGGTVWLLYGRLDGLAVVLAAALGFAVTSLLLGLALLRRLRACRGSGGNSPEAPRSELAPLLGSSLLGMLFLQFPFLVLPFFAGAEDTGLFALAYKIVNLITTILLMLGALYGPRFARAWAGADSNRLLTLLRETQLFAVALFAPVALVLSVYGQGVLELFGEGFGAAEPYLWVLLLGQLCNAATGLPGLFLNMAGAGRQEFNCLALTLVMALLAVLFVGPTHGAMGVAAVYSAALAIKNLASLALARRLLKPAGFTRPAETSL